MAMPSRNLSTENKSNHEIESHRSGARILNKGFKSKKIDT